jgi:hypothetical protein
MKRKKFFNVFGLGILGILFTKFSSQNISFRNLKGKKKINVNINPLAVKRNKIGGKNV